MTSRSILENQFSTRSRTWSTSRARSSRRTRRSSPLSGVFTFFPWSNAPADEDDSRLPGSAAPHFMQKLAAAARGAPHLRQGSKAIFERSSACSTKVGP